MPSIFNKSGGKSDFKKIDYTRHFGLSGRWMSKTVLGLILVIFVVTIGSVVVNKPAPLMPDPLPKGHQLVTEKCEACHINGLLSFHKDGVGAFYKNDAGSFDKACIKCHTLGDHAEVIASSSCTTCHGQHQPNISVVSIPDGFCVKCHANLLKAKKGTPPGFDENIQSFNQGHPEFKVLLKEGNVTKRVSLDDRDHLSDTARIKLNHALHLKPNIRGPNGPAKLECKNCHEASVDGTNMVPVTYEKNCKTCHDLRFDPKNPDRLIPHASPEEVTNYLRLSMTEAYADKPYESERRRRLPGSRMESNSLPLASRVAKEILKVEHLLYNVTCNKCHMIDKKNASLPRIQKTDIPTVWLTHARFQHQTHLQLKCEACHQDVGKSKVTTDVLLPKIQVCQDCHQGNREQADCITCHVYHKPSKSKIEKHPFTIPDLLRGGKQASFLKNHEIMRDTDGAGRGNL